MRGFPWNVGQLTLAVGPLGSASMTKADIIESVYEKVGFSKKESAELVELAFDTLKETLEKGDKVKVSGFGNFQPRFKWARPGRNPQSGQPIEITARRVVKFVPSQVLKAELNEGAVPLDEVSAEDEDAGHSPPADDEDED
jgi:integration host factor subunit alpha